MLTPQQIRDDLKDIRYYYSRKEAFENGFRVIGSNDIVGKAKRYSTQKTIFLNPNTTLQK